MARKAPQTSPETESIEELLAGKRPRKVSLQRLEELLRTWPDHAGTKLYCYRLKPEIDLSRIGKTGSNIGIMQAVYPDDLRKWFLSMHGGGLYELKFNDLNEAHSPIAVTQLEIPISEGEPILDVRTLVRGPVETEQLIQKWLNEGKITKDQAGELHPAAPGASPQAAHTAAAGDGTPASVIDLMNHTYKSMFDQAMRQNDPVAMAKLMKELKGDGMDLPTMLALFQQLQPKENPMMAMFMNMMLEMQKQTSAINQMLMQRLLEKPEASAQPGGLSAMKEMVEFVSLMRDEFGVATPVAKASGFMDQLAKFAPAFTPILAPAVMKLLTPAGPADIAAPASPANPAAPAQQPSDAAAQAHQQANRRLATLMLNCLDRNLDGNDLATTINLQWGEEAYDGLKAFGRDGIVNSIQSAAPDLWEQMAARAEQVNTLLDEFLTAFDEAEAPGA